MMVRFLACRSGATSIEYALLAGGIALAIIIGATLVGNKLNAVFQRLVANGFS